jgi:hypothetical protein
MSRFGIPGLPRLLVAYEQRLGVVPQPFCHFEHRLDYRATIRVRKRVNQDEKILAGSIFGAQSVDLTRQEAI